MDPQTTTPTLLCQHRGSTCGACCWGVGVSRADLQRRLHRHTRLFAPIRDSLPTLWQCLLHELRSRRGADLVWGLLYLIPMIGPKLRRRHSRDLVCAFMGFTDDHKTKVGCLLHPSRFHGSDRRNARAFALLPGVSCGDPNYVCSAGHRYDALPLVQQIGFDDCVADLDWYDYTNTIRAFSCAAVVPPDPPRSTA